MISLTQQLSILAQEGTISFWDAEWFNENLPPFGEWINDSINWLAVNLATFWDVIAWPIDALLGYFTGFLQWVPWPIIVVAVVALGWVLRNWKIGLVSGVSLLGMGFLGADFWDLGMQTFAMIITAVVFCVIIGMPLGIMAARSDNFDGTLRPALDAMQTIHPFVYLLPAVFFFGIGTVPGVVVTVIFAMPPMARLTNLGIRPLRCCRGGTRLRDARLPAAQGDPASSGQANDPGRSEPDIDAVSVDGGHRGADRAEWARRFSVASRMGTMLSPAPPESRFC